MHEFAVTPQLPGSGGAEVPLGTPPGEVGGGGGELNPCECGSAGFDISV